MLRVNPNVVFLEPAKVRLSARARSHISKSLKGLEIDLIPVLTLSQSTRIESAVGELLDSFGPSLDLGYFHKRDLSKDDLRHVSQDGILFQIPLELDAEEKLTIDFDQIFLLVGANLNDM
jgi:hypothetical protein